MIASGFAAQTAVDSSLDGAPVLCGRCGAPTRVDHDLSVTCRYCGLADRLPPDALSRALEIRRRLALAASRVAQLEGVERALASIFEARRAFLRVLGPWPFVALLVTAYALYGAWTTLDRLPAKTPDAVRVELVVAAAYAPLFVLGVTLSFPAALLVGRVAYRRRVRPFLRARPALAAGASMRCRGCGGELAASRDALVVCRYCGSQNLLGEEAAQERARRLQEEELAYRSHAGSAVARTSGAGVLMTRTLVACFVVVYLGIVGLGCAASVIVQALA